MEENNAILTQEETMPGAEPMKRSNRIKRRGGDRTTDIVINAVLVIIALVCLYPLWFVLIASFSDPSAIIRGEVFLWPVKITTAAYEGLLDRPEIWVGYRNTIFYTVTGTLWTLFCTVPVAYALSRKDLPGRRFFNLLFLLTMYFSGGIIPQFLLMNSLGLVDTVWALIIPGAVTAYNMIITRSFFQGNIPEELYDASRIDGTSYTGFFLRVVLPLSKAIIAILSLFAIQRCWNTYMSAKIYIISDELYTLQQTIQIIISNANTGLQQLQASDPQAYLQKMREQQLLKYAIVIISIAPLIAIYPVIQKYLVKGVMVGAVKG